MCGAGDPCSRHGASISIYACNSSMDNRAFCNADGDVLIGIEFNLFQINFFLRK